MGKRSIKPALVNEVPGGTRAVVVITLTLLSLSLRS